MSGIILFDGVCNFCDSSVQFIMKRDSKEYFKFASLQSEIGQKLLKEYQASKGLDSVVLIENNRLYVESDAALAICRHLDGPWKLLWGLKIIPAPIRNKIYQFIAKNRYKWFGQKEACRIPSPKERKRFLE
ncbi:thiol-disulfide oxidoreductase DCC family protein [Falsibacillus pallidus]|uniref:Putative DCC family thiol-disulfide oxidoreductase YuxK n=1 Tax=Falsibacillus pallidus TaxID=493781 RepID=A0A370GV28_9BACI|nr:thiol-disulfide oxidoreductase DCC family protein [Falsibacillus pallidus]RDI45783.1 putative DCC family thiol-disulfide oxidoreductase YuxK [Falsibacillus pallidus]